MNTTYNSALNRGVIGFLIAMIMVLVCALVHVNEKHQKSVEISAVMASRLVMDTLETQYPEVMSESKIREVIQEELDSVFIPEGKEKELAFKLCLESSRLEGRY